MKYKIISDVQHCYDMEKYEVINADGFTSMLCTCNLSDFVSKPFTKNTKLKIKSPAIDREENGFICPYDNEIVVVPKKDYWKVVVVDVSFLCDSIIFCENKNKSFGICTVDLDYDLESISVGDKFVLKKSAEMIDEDCYLPTSEEFYKA